MLLSPAAAGPVVDRFPACSTRNLQRCRKGGTFVFRRLRETRRSAVAPRSLYLQQLEERLGTEAVEDVTTEAQRKAVAKGPKDSPLSKWIIIYEEIRARLSQ